MAIHRYISMAIDEPDSEVSAKADGNSVWISADDRTVKIPLGVFCDIAGEIFRFRDGLLAADDQSPLISATDIFDRIQGLSSMADGHDGR